jgi:hypothetical protein
MPFVASTPSTITPAARVFARKVSRGFEPDFIDITPLSGCLPGNCHLNVARLVRERGGSGETGWAIWQYGRLWLEAEFHEIWVTPEGRRLDVTPDADGEVRRLFVPDPSRRFDGYVIPKRYQVLKKSGDVRRAVRSYAEAERIRCRYRVGEAVAPADVLRILSAQSQASAALLSYRRRHG